MVISEAYLSKVGAGACARALSALPVFTTGGAQTAGVASILGV